MTKAFQRGLVVGKFAPLHRGHQAVIARAEEQCEHVVIISYTNPEFDGYDPDERARWLAELYPKATRLVVTPRRMAVPPNDASDHVHREFVGYLCESALGLRVDAVFTSEYYGDGFARELTRYFRRRDPQCREVRHILVDRDRIGVPISGTAIRRDVHSHREWLDPAVYASFVRRVALLGGESSGKSTLARELALATGTTSVGEYGRERWEAKNGALEFDDLLQIAEEQVRREEAAIRRANRFVFCDTTPLTTLFYSMDLFDKAEDALVELASRSYDHLILCAPDFAFVQDGTRRDNAFRTRQHEWYVSELSRRGVSFDTVCGSVAERVAEVRRIIEREPAISGP